MLKGMLLLKRLAALLMALLLMAAFYLYALMREDEQSKRTAQWVVAQEEDELRPFGGMEAADPAALAQAMGCAIPLPPQLQLSRVSDQRHHGYYVRRLTAGDGHALVLGVRPASASPLIRPEGLHFTHASKTLLGIPMLSAQDDLYSYYYLATEQAAFVIRLPLPHQDELLSSFIIAEP